MNTNVLRELTGILGKDYVIAEPEELLCYGDDATPGFTHLPDVIAGLSRGYPRVYSRLRH